MGRTGAALYSTVQYAGKSQKVLGTVQYSTGLYYSTVQYWTVPELHMFCPSQQ